MTVYDVVLFAHITSVIIMFAGVTADWPAAAGLRATRDAGPARAWIRTLEISAAFGPWARLAVLGVGLYLAVDAWSWQGWIIAGLISWVAFVILGEPLTGRELRDMAAAVAAEHGTLPPALIARLHLPRMWQAGLHQGRPGYRRRVRHGRQAASDGGRRSRRPRRTGRLQLGTAVVPAWPGRHTV
jgi:hypothetical protein